LAQHKPTRVPHTRRVSYGSVSISEKPREIRSFYEGLWIASPTRLGRYILGPLIGDLSVTVNGLDLSGPIEESGLLYKIGAGHFEPFLRELFFRVVKPGMVVLDLGANIGFYTIFAAHSVGPKGKVYAFEPDKRSFSYLVRNIQMNNFSDRVIAVPKAVSDKEGKALFFLHGWAHGSSLFRYEGSIKKSQVECITIDEFTDKTISVDIIKIDIEGAEFCALNIMKYTITHASNNLTMFVECNPHALCTSGSSPGALIEQLKSLGFTVMIIDEHRQCLCPVISDVASKTVNLYCTLNK
jgi:FkbM family methyltransferase